MFRLPNIINLHSIVLILVLIPVLGSCTGNPELGRNKIEPCTACHTDTGNSLSKAWPNLASQIPSYIVKQLKDFQEGENGNRYDPNMYTMSLNLSLQDMNDIAAYYSQQKLNKQKIDPEYFELGQKIYRGGLIEKGLPACASCHMMDGSGNAGAGFPRLSGQNDEYIVSQLIKFKEGERTNDLNGIMRDIAVNMSNEEMEAVASYVSGLS